jgi:hypothetical protein
VQYRIAVYAEELGQWVQVGPVFTSLEEAVQFLDTFATPFKRLVQVDDLEPVPATGGSPMAGVGDGEVTLDPKRLEFVRYLIQTGRLNDGVKAARRQPVAA